MAAAGAAQRLAGCVMAWALMAADPLPAAAKPAPCVTAADRVVIDVGHDQRRPGAISSLGRPEFGFNLDLAEAVAGRLRRDGFRDIVLINRDGAGLTLAERVAAINRADGRMVISIHHDSVQPRYLQPWQVEGVPQTFTSHARGYSLFVSRDNPDYAASLALATALGRSLRAAGLAPSAHHGEPIDGENREVVDGTLGIYGFDGLAVLRGSRAAAVLLEAAVIKHPEDEALADSPSFRATVAAAVAAALTSGCPPAPRGGQK